MGYLDNLGVDTAAHAEKKGNSSYLSWAVAYSLAGAPTFSVASFADRPYREVLGGVVVGVDMPVGPQGRMQRMWLPILDNNNKPLPRGKISARDITDSHARALVKAIAATCGVGMSLYAGFHGDGPRAKTMLGNVDTTTNMFTLKPVTEKKQSQQYVAWWAAIAAGMASAADFHWEVPEFVDSSGVSQPFLIAESGYLVAVDVTWRGRTHRQWLPIMDSRNSAKSNPDVYDWNKTVLRCLTKGFAVVSGYGLSVYAGEDMSVTPKVTSGDPDAALAAAQAQAAVDLTAVPAGVSPAEAAYIARVMAKVTGTDKVVAAREHIKTSPKIASAAARAWVVALLDKIEQDAGALLV